MDSDQVKELIEKGIPGSQVEVIDTRGTGDHFKAIVISDSFKEMTLVQQHQTVYRILGKLMTNEIHALQLNTYTLEKWQKENQ